MIERERERERKKEREREREREREMSMRLVESVHHKGKAHQQPWKGWYPCQGHTRIFDAGKEVAH